jgi:hypothetical protein
MRCWDPDFDRTPKRKEQHDASKLVGRTVRRFILSLVRLPALGNWEW